MDHRWNQCVYDMWMLFVIEKKQGVRGHTYPNGNGLTGTFCTLMIAAPVTK